MLTDSVFNKYEGSLLFPADKGGETKIFVVGQDLLNAETTHGVFLGQLGYL